MTFEQLQRMSIEDVMNASPFEVNLLPREANAFWIRIMMDVPAEKRGQFAVSYLVSFPIPGIYSSTKYTYLVVCERPDSLWDKNTDG